MEFIVKICGVTTPAALDAAAAAGASHAGLVFFPPSPRHLSAEAAARLAAAAPADLELVGLFVDPEDAALDSVLEAVPLDAIQLHGAESPERLADIRRRTRRPVWKALGVGEAEDLARAAEYGEADRLLFDARPPQGAARPGGNAAAFDWCLLASAPPAPPWILSGGLTPGNIHFAIETAIACQGFTGVDVSSGVESGPGEKDLDLIAEFTAAARRAFAARSATSDKFD
ncbi:MAG: phosphoribosylanthranilate isomerase [Parvularculaceae bacterium]